MLTRFCPLPDIVIGGAETLRTCGGGGLRSADAGTNPLNLLPVTLRFVFCFVCNVAAFANALGTVLRFFSVLAMYLWAVLSLAQRPCVFKSSQEISAYDAAVAPPRRPECSPNKDGSRPIMAINAFKSSSAVEYPIRQFHNPVCPVRVVLIGGCRYPFFVP